MRDLVNHDLVTGELQWTLLTICVDITMHNKVNSVSG